MHGAATAITVANSEFCRTTSLPLALRVNLLTLPLPLALGVAACYRVWLRCEARQRKTNSY
ncbi:uncharacterized protein K444DRAFT_622696 [Hyaloscypha bicolor E]|uniref:Uncharacterized protein n=1 Tax=Hyaloscypha bicolor E TaxID=1095630 RepID=A0A2J6SFU3_9HELO|nr:uncharacterized protein K444DRAFT_622696 [Hyaloscypha bicolor E]PMD49626.1 hypothetical protein K444DRAFT_622696 [Hyaloscypha bicolor E]